MRGIRCFAGGFIAASLLLFGAPFAGVAAASDVNCGDTITANTTLTHDVGPCAGDGLIIGANNITVDLNGRRLFGTQGLDDVTGVGVRLSGHSGVTITSTAGGGQIDHFDAGVAINGTTSATSGNTVSNLTLRDNFPESLLGSDNGDGVNVQGGFADNTSILNNTVVNNGPFSGISTFGATIANKMTGVVISGNTVQDNNSQSSQTGGIRVENWTWDSTVSNNTVTGSALEGIALFADTQSIDVLNNTISANGFRDVTATGRKGDGIRAFARTKFHLIKANTVTANAGHGIRLDGPASATIPGANDHEVVGNTATGNDQAVDNPPPLDPAPHTDLSDGNANCDNNSWRGNVYGTAHPDCTKGPFQSDLSVTKTDSPDPVTLGENVTYTVTVSNAGPDDAGGVTLTDALPSGTAFRSATANQGSCSQSGGTVTCSLGTVASGASASVSIVVEADAVGTISNTASVTSSSSDPNASNNSATATTTVENTRGCTIIGTSGDDVLTGTSGNDVICGLGGNDTISGGDGNDTLLGGHGNDSVNGGNQDDAIEGGDGDDTLHGNNGKDNLNGGAGSDSLFGDHGDDSLDSVDGVSGNDANDGGMGVDACSADVGDSVVSCP